MYSDWAIQVAEKEAEALGTVLAPNIAHFGPDALCRACIESASLAWWLLDPSLTASQRTARALLFQLNGNLEAEKITAEFAGDQDIAKIGESSASAREAIAEYGLTLERRERLLDGQRLPGYSERVRDLVRRVWTPSMPRFSYAVLSATAHAELLGLVRGFDIEPGESQRFRVAPDRSAPWLWFDAYLTTGSLLLSADCAARFLGLDNETTAIRAWIATAQGQLDALRPEESVFSTGNEARSS